MTRARFIPRSEGRGKKQISPWRCGKRSSAGVRFVELCHGARHMSTPWHRRKKVGPVATGTVKSFDEDKGYGYISQDDGGADAGLHFWVIQSNGFRKLQKNQRVGYEEPWT